MRLTLRFIFTLAAAAFQAASQTPSHVPDNLKPAAGEKLAQQVHASGDQIYTCNGVQWTLTGPDAKLFDASGKEVGSHFAGPTWQWSDGSQVKGKPVSNATPDPKSIPWLLLTATDHGGRGVMEQITSIQRLHTAGGKAPATGCDAVRKGQETRSHYTADYYFYRSVK